MFTVNNYRISFCKNYSLIVPKRAQQGHYDTCCKIVDFSLVDESGEVVNKYEATAYLHPNDKPDKIIGKKVALTKALAKIKGLDKQKRTKIWMAFWIWVASWKLKSCNTKKGNNNVKEETKEKSSKEKA